MKIAGVTSCLASTLVVIGCGSDPQPSRRGILPLVSHPKAPANYTLEDPDCLSQSETMPLTGTQIQAWDGDQVIPRDVTLTGVASGESLTSPIVRMTTWNDHFQRVCDLDRGLDHACDDLADGGEKEWYLNQKTSGGFLRICKDQHAYGRETYEGVALTSLSYVERANSQYMRLAEPSRPLPKINLSVLPEFIDYYDNYVHEGQLKRLKTWITHNLAYFQGGMIAVFPENIVERPKAKGFFWESEFVLAHEFGHHIEWARHGSPLQAAGFAWNALTHSVDDITAVRAGQNITSARGKLVGALSEAYADMLAYYTEGATARSLTGIPELGIDRNVGSGTFASGDAKILTADRLEMLLSGAPEMSSSEPAYGEIHISGAIFAHALDKIFATLSQADARIVANSELDLSRRYRLTLNWMDALMQDLPPVDATGAAVIAPVGRAIEAAIEGFLTKFPLSGTDSPTSIDVKAEICRDLATSLPALQDAPFAVDGHNCDRPAS